MARRAIVRHALTFLFFFIPSIVLSAPPSRVYTYTTGNKILPDEVTENENAIFRYLSTGIDTLASNIAITTSGTCAFSGALNSTGSFSATGASNTIGDGGSDALSLNIPGGLTFPSAATWTFTGAQTVSGTWANLGTATTIDINGGTIDGVTIGASSAPTITNLGTVATTGAITLGGKLTAGANEIEGSNFDITGGTISGITTFSAGGDLDIGTYELRANTFESDVATGTAPFTIASTTKVTNLNADTVDGIDSTSFSRKQLFTSSDTFTAPTGITTVYLTMCGGGGGGGNNAKGGGGGGGAYVIKFPYTVVAGNNYTVTIGAGGAGGTPGTNGGDTTFDTFTLDGGYGGTGSDGGAAGAGGIGFIMTGDGGNLIARNGISGGSGGAGVAATTAGSGGGTPFGYISAGVSYGYGVGGSGGSAPYSGTNGMCLVEW